MKPKPKLAWMLLLLVLLMVAAGLWLPQLAAHLLPEVSGLLLAWALVAFLMLLALGITGSSLGRGKAGILIDPLTNMMSLSRLQIVLWTWVILSAFITLAAARVWDARTNQTAYQCAAPAEGQEATCADPLGIQLPLLLWALMGISLTSAVGSPLLKTAKAQKTTDQDERTAEGVRARRATDPSAVALTYRSALKSRTDKDSTLKEEIGDTKSLGALVRRDPKKKATFSDTYTGEEVASFGYVDIAKVQNLFFSVIAVAAYAVALAADMNTQEVAKLFAFPDPTPGLVAVIGISATGYLVDKAATHSVPEEEKPPEV